MSRSNWRSGDRWRIYTGAGNPVTVSIQDLALEGHGDGSAAVVAVAQFPDEDTANRVFGLRASGYLAVPGLGIDETPDRPLMPDDYFEGVVELEQLLKAHGVAIVKQRQAGNDGGSAEALKLDKAFLDAGSFAAQTHISRWNPQGGKPLLFAEIVWQSKDGEAVFAANAIVEQGQTLEILDFDSRPAEQMRVPYNEKADTWHSYVPVFLNAWVLGTHHFVLKYTQYYEGFSVDLMELVPGKGLVPTGLSYGDGA